MVFYNIQSSKPLTLNCIASLCVIIPLEVDKIKIEDFKVLFSIRKARNDIAYFRDAVVTRRILLKKDLFR
jgi:hypothetical protein